MNYKSKLRAFNNTEKYRNELVLLYALLNPNSDDVIVDYGCGLGTAADFIRKRTTSMVIGFDIHELYYEYEKEYFTNKLNFKADKVYFMHSLAHIYNIDEVLNNLRFNVLKGEKELVIITPNVDWVEEMKNDKYIPDPTVVQHYSQGQLKLILNAQGFKVKSICDFGASANGRNIYERIMIKAKAI